MTTVDLIHKCNTTECCYFEKASPHSCGCHRDEKQMMRDAIVERDADIAWQAKLLDRVRDKILCINDEIEDEGDRAYFGSTNHADDFRDIAKRVEHWDYDRILAQGSKRDLYTEMAGLRGELNTLTAENAALKARIAAQSASLAELTASGEALLTAYDAVKAECERLHETWPQWALDIKAILEGCGVDFRGEDEIDLPESLRQWTSDMEAECDKATLAIRVEMETDRHMGVAEHYRAQAWLLRALNTELFRVGCNLLAFAEIKWGNLDPDANEAFADARAVIAKAKESAS